VAIPGPDGDQRDARILLVDDDPMLLRALAEVLTSRLDGAVLDTCHSAVDALARIEARAPDIVISDLLMGGLHGLELLQHIRSSHPDVVVLLVTGAADRDLGQRALRGGAYDFIQKPVDPEYLVASVGRAIEARRLRAEVERQQATLRRHAEELEMIVAQRTGELHRASRAKDEFLATVSHELRTPLTAILGWARLLSGGRLDAGETAQAIDSIACNAKAQAQLVDDLLDVSRIVTDNLRLDVQRVDLLRLIDRAVGVVLPAAQAKGIALELHLDESIEPIQVDPHRLQQVLWNLLSNAVKFTPDDGHIDVDLSQRGERVEIAVVDDGAGIEPELLPLVFERFRQGNSQSATRRGLGLGLAIARHLAELHGGTITAESAGPGAGSTFTVSLPCPARKRTGALRRRRELPSASGADAGSCLRGVRVLVIDDEADTRAVLRLTLMHAGATVELASSVPEAHEAFRRTHPDVLLCDIGLGSDDGYTLLRSLRALPRELGGGVPAVALTGYAKPEDREEALLAGFDLHVAKPGPADLPQLLADLVGHGDRG
jgi:signal transduction histidine kinase